MSDRKVRLIAEVKGNMKSELTGIGSSLGDLAKKLGLLYIAQRAGSEAMRFLTNSTNMAIAANEQLNKFLVVMGDNSENAERSLGALADSTNRNVDELRAMAAGMQDMLVPAGIVRSEAAGLSVNFVRLATDISSFNNIPTADVLYGIQSALAGSTEALRRYGIDSRATSLEAMALSMGITESWQTMSQANKAQVLYAKICADTSDAQGDAERTASSAANTLVGLKSAFAEAQVEIGKNFIPVVESLGPIAEENLIMVMGRVDEAVSKMAGILLEVGPEVLNEIGAWLSMFAQGGTAIMNFGEAMEGTSSSVGQLTEVISYMVGTGELKWLIEQALKLPGAMAEVDRAVADMEDSANRLADSEQILAIVQSDWQAVLEEGGPALDQYILTLQRASARGLSTGGVLEQLVARQTELARQQGILNGTTERLTFKTEGLSRAMLLVEIAAVNAQLEILRLNVAMSDQAGPTVIGAQIADLLEYRAQLKALGGESSIPEEDFISGGGSSPESPKPELNPGEAEKAEILARNEARIAHAEALKQSAVELYEQGLSRIETAKQAELDAIAQVAEARAEQEAIADANLKRWGIEFGKAMMSGAEGARAWGKSMIEQMRNILMEKAFGMIMNLITGGGTGIFGKIAGFFTGGKMQGGGVVHAQGGLNAVPNYGSARGDRVPVLLDPTETVLTRGQMQDRASFSSSKQSSVVINFSSVLGAYSKAMQAEMAPFIIDTLRRAGVSVSMGG